MKFKTAIATGLVGLAMLGCKQNTEKRNRVYLSGRVTYMSPDNAVPIYMLVETPKGLYHITLENTVANNQCGGKRAEQFLYELHSVTDKVNFYVGTQYEYFDQAGKKVGSEFSSEFPARQGALCAEEFQLLPKQ